MRGCPTRCDGAQGPPGCRTHTRHVELGGGGALTWYVNDKKQSGDPADYQPKDHDKIVLVFAPEGTTLQTIEAEKGLPPNSQQVPTDEAPYSTTPGGSAPAPVPESPR